MVGDGCRESFQPVPRAGVAFVRMRRLERIAASMRVLRKSRQAVATFGALAALGMAIND